MMLTKLKWAAAVLVSGLALTGAGVMARQGAKPRRSSAGRSPAGRSFRCREIRVPVSPVKSFEAEAELWLAKAKSIRAEEPTSPGEEAGPQGGAAQPKPHRPEPGSAPGDGRGQDPRSRRISPSSRI